MNKKTIIGFALVIIGALVFFWAQSHSPNDDLGNKIMKEFNGSFTLDQTSYIGCMIGAIALAVLGLIQIFRK